MGQVVPSGDYWYIIEVAASDDSPKQKIKDYITVRNQ